MNGKGSKPRPFSVSQKQFGDSWDQIFGKKDGNLEKVPHIYESPDGGKTVYARPFGSTERTVVKKECINTTQSDDGSIDNGSEEKKEEREAGS